eukprot:365377-Chlamydomonas_euryale.AAC.40
MFPPPFNLPFPPRQWVRAAGCIRQGCRRTFLSCTWLLLLHGGNAPLSAYGGLPMLLGTDSFGAILRGVSSGFLFLRSGREHPCTGAIKPGRRKGATWCCSSGPSSSASPRHYVQRMQAPDAAMHAQTACHDAGMARMDAFGPDDCCVALEWLPLQGTLACIRTHSILGPAKMLPKPKPLAMPNTRVKSCRLCCGVSRRGDPCMMWGASGAAARRWGAAPAGDDASCTLLLLLVLAPEHAVLAAIVWRAAMPKACRVVPCMADASAAPPR